MKILIGICLLFLSSDVFATEGTATACTCKYEGISGDYALYLGVWNFQGKQISNTHVGNYYSEGQCTYEASSAPACGKVNGGYQQCSCKYDVISGDYRLTRQIFDNSGKGVLSQNLGLYFSESQCTNAALMLSACS